MKAGNFYEPLFNSVFNCVSRAGELKSFHEPAGILA